MTICSERVAVLLRDAWPAVEVGSPVPLTGGFWASMFRVPVRHQPAGVADQVVVRFAPHRAMGAKEAEVQRAVASQGFPTPALWLSCPDQTSGGWWSVMAFSPGRPLLTGLDHQDQSQAEHRAMLDACRRGDGNAAAATLRRHLEDGGRRLLAAIVEGGA